MDYDVNMIGNVRFRKPSSSFHFSRESFRKNSLALFYGMALFFLLARRSESDSSIFLPSLPQFLLQFTGISLYLCGVSLVIVSAIIFVSGKVRMPALILLIYVAGLSFYNIRIFDSEAAGLSLIGIFLPYLMLFSVSPSCVSVGLDCSHDIVFRSLSICFGIFVILNMSLLLMGYGYYGFLSSRYSGITFHPNQFGMAASLGFLFFM